MTDEKPNESKKVAEIADEDQTVRVRVQLPPPEEDEIDSDITTTIRVADMQKAGIKPPAPPQREAAVQQTTIPVPEPVPAMKPNPGVLVLIGAVAGGALGFLVDRLAANNGFPWGLILGLVLGAGAGAVIGTRQQN